MAGIIWHSLLPLLDFTATNCHDQLLTVGGWVAKQWTLGGKVVKQTTVSRGLNWYLQWWLTVHAAWRPLHSVAQVLWYNWDSLVVSVISNRNHDFSPKPNRIELEMKTAEMSLPYKHLSLFQKLSRPQQFKKISQNFTDEWKLSSTYLSAAWDILDFSR